MTIRSPIDEVIAQSVRRHRERLDLSQAELARKMSAQGHGWHPMTVNRCEEGDRPLRVSEAAALAGIFDIPLSKLLEPPAPPANEEALRRLSLLQQHIGDLEAQRARIAEERQVLAVRTAEEEHRARLMEERVAIAMEEAREAEIKTAQLKDRSEIVAHELTRISAELEAARAAWSYEMENSLALRSRPVTFAPDTWTAQNCSVLLTDVVGFGAPTHTAQDRKIIRDGMYQIVRRAFAAASISREDYLLEDRGDGILIVISPDVPTKQIVHPLVTRIAAELSRYNADAEDGTRFKLRVALQVGPVEPDPEGVNGHVIVDASRLIEASAFKQGLAQAPPETCVGFITSDYVYDSVIKQHPRQLEPYKYQKITARAKGRRLTAWVNFGLG